MFQVRPKNQILFWYKKNSRVIKSYKWNRASAINCLFYKHFIWLCEKDNLVGLTWSEFSKRMQPQMAKQTWMYWPSELINKRQVNMFRNLKSLIIPSYSNVLLRLISRNMPLNLITTNPDCYTAWLEYYVRILFINNRS